MSDRRQNILNAFGQLVERQGINKTTMQDVAGEIGVSIGTLYNEFTNKEEMITEFCQKLQGVVYEGIKEILSQQQGLTAIQALRALIVGHVDKFNALLRNNRGFVELVWDTVSFRYIGKTAVNMRNMIRQELITAASEVLRQGVNAKEFRCDLPVTSATSLIDAFAEYWLPPLILPREHKDVMVDANQMFDLLVFALKADATLLS